MRCNPKQKKCPECGKQFQYESVATHPNFPFCSDMCKLLDLGRWLKGEYAIVEDLKRGQDLKNPAEIDDPDVKAAMDEMDDA